MDRRTYARLAPRVALVAAALLAVPLPAVPASLEKVAERPLPLFVKGTVKRSVQIALRKIERDECRALYSDFADAGGRTLADKLAVKGASPQAHLMGLRFKNGAGHPRCQDPNIFFVTHVVPGLSQGSSSRCSAFTSGSKSRRSVVAIRGRRRVSEVATIAASTKPSSRSAKRRFRSATRL